MKKTQQVIEKTGPHPRNPHRFRYDFELLLNNCPELKNFVYANEHRSVASEVTIDFSNPDAVKALNNALLN